MFETRMLPFSCTRVQTLMLAVGISLFGIIIYGFLSSNPMCSISTLKPAASPIVNRSHVGEDKEQPLGMPMGLSYKQPAVTGGRADVVSVTPWLAPIVWEGTFDPVLIDGMYKSMNFTIATTVFAIGKYTKFLQDFLETAEKHFLVGLRVHYHIFTDQPNEIPRVTLAAWRQIFVHQVPKLNRWQDISSSRMQIIQSIIEERFFQEVDYIFCQDVDSKFHFRWGAETLGQLVAQIHPWFYDMSQNEFTYERRNTSKAYIPFGQGDFYYIGAMFGGSVKEVHKLVKKCREHIDADKANSIEAIWQEESHLNWYLLYNKPTKVLSPEYLWDDKRGQTNLIRVVRLSHVIKQYEEVRENV